MKIKNSPKKEIVLCILCILLIMIEPKSMVAVAKVKNMDAIRVMLLAGLILIFLFRHQYSIDRNTIQFFVLSIGVILLSIVTNGDTSNYSYALMIVISSSMLISELFSFDEFKKAYVTAIVLLCQYSLLSTYLFQNIPALSKGFLPTFAHQNGGIAIDYIFSFAFTMEYGRTFRNFGLFNEPGVYLFYITVAGALLMFTKDNETKNAKWTNISIATILITLISLLSPMGYLICFGFICGLLLSRGNKSQHMKYILITAVMIFVSGFLLKFLLGESVFDLVSGSLGKLSHKGGSFYSRFGSIIASIQAFSDKPIFGWGYSGTFTTVIEKYLAKYTIHYTNTVGLIFVIYGGLMGIMFVGTLWSFFKKHSTSILTCVISFLCILAALSNESLVDSTLLWLLIMYGVKERRLQYV